MTQALNWQEMWDDAARLLKERTGKDVQSWNRRIKKEGLNDKQSLREWLTKQGVTGYPKTLLMMERFGYPDHYVASSDELIKGQYKDRPALRPILDAIIDAASGLGDVIIQTRKTYVSLVTQKRTFARVQPTTRTRVDLGLRLEGIKTGGRLKPSKLNETMRHQIGLTSVDDIDEELLNWLELAYEQNS